jgi:hypothetical protein
MRATPLRVILSPITTLRAIRLRWLSRSPFDFDSAWRQARMHRAPDEVEYLLQRYIQEREVRRAEP